MLPKTYFFLRLLTLKFLPDNHLRFVMPVYPGDSIHVRLTVKQKTAKDTPEAGIPQGVVEWDVEVRNQLNEPVAVYSILTLVKRKEE